MLLIALLLQEVYNKKHKMYYVKSLKVLTLDVVRNMKNVDLLSDHVDNETEECNSLSVHFGKGIFTEIDK